MTVKKTMALLTALILTWALCIPIFAQEQQVSDTARITLANFDVPCKNAIMISADTGQVMYEKDSDKQVPIASITKVMTLLLTFEAIESGKIALTDKVPVSTHAFEMGGSQIWLEPGEDFTLEEMIKAICISSANDAAVAVAEFVGGSEPVFADMMNKRAAELNMKNTVFKNACGLDEQGHLSTARDVALMSREMLKHKDIHKYSTVWMDSLRNGQTQLVNTNKLLKSYAGINGLKTGTTGGAGVCISASAEREGMTLIAVVLGASNAKERFAAATQMLDYGFSTYEVAPFPAIEAAVESLPVTLGEEKSAKVVYKTPEKLLLKKGEGKNVTATAHIPSRLVAPVAPDTQIGEVTVYVKEEVIAKYPVCVMQQVEKISFGSAMSVLIDALMHL